MINIAFITNSVKRCGPVNVIYDIIENLNRVHFNPIVITLATISDFTKQDSREEEFKNLGIRVIKLNIEYIRLELMSKVIAKKIAKMIRGEESHGSSINETPIQEAKCEVEEEKEPPHVEMETTSSEVFNFNGSSDMI